MVIEVLNERSYQVLVEISLKSCSSHGEPNLYLLERLLLGGSEVLVVAGVELPEEHVDHAPVVVHLQLLQERPPHLQVMHAISLGQPNKI